MKKVLGIAAVMFLLVGCGGGKATTNVCKGTVSGMELTNEISATGDKVIKTNEKGVYDFTDQNPSKEQIEELADLIGETYDGVKGIDFDYEIKDKKLTFTVVTDYEKADLEVLQEKGLVEFQKDGSTKYVGVKATVEALEKQGLTCTEK